MTDEVDHYKNLQIAYGATNDAIKVAYRKLAIKLHPDKNKDDPDAGKIIIIRRKEI